jgi:hypothetical protein
MLAENAFTWGILKIIMITFCEGPIKVFLAKKHIELRDVPIIN